MDGRIRWQKRFGRRPWFSSCPLMSESVAALTCLPPVPTRGLWLQGPFLPQHINSCSLESLSGLSSCVTIISSLEEHFFMCGPFRLEHWSSL